MRKFVLLFLVIVIACKSTKKTEAVYSKTSSGISYLKLITKDSTQAQIGDMVEISYVGKYADDSVFYRSKVNEVRTFTLGFNEVGKGMEEAVKLLRCGEKGIFKMPKAMAFSKLERFSYPQADSVITYEIELKKVVANPSLHPLKAERLKDTTHLAGGLDVIVAGKGKGEKVEVGDEVTIHYNGMLTDFTFFDSSNRRNQPIKVKIGSGQVIAGWEMAIPTLNVGDTARIVIPAALGYGTKARPTIPANSTLLFDVVVVSTKKPLKIVPYNVEGKKLQKTASGLQYIVLDEGTGKKPVAGNTIDVHYSGYLVDGKRFDSSVERGAPFSFNVGMGYVIKGWDEGLLLMKEGAKFRFIIPYELAYGENGYPPVIPAKSTLIFDVELLKVK